MTLPFFEDNNLPVAQQIAKNLCQSFPYPRGMYLAIMLEMLSRELWIKRDPECLKDTATFVGYFVEVKKIRQIFAHVTEYKNRLDSMSDDEVLLTFVKFFIKKIEIPDSEDLTQE